MTVEEAIARLQEILASGVEPGSLLELALGDMTLDRIVDIDIIDDHVVALASNKLDLA